MSDDLGRAAGLMSTLEDAAERYRTGEITGLEVVETIEECTKMFDNLREVREWKQFVFPKRF